MAEPNENLLAPINDHSTRRTILEMIGGLGGIAKGMTQPFVQHDQRQYQRAMNQRAWQAMQASLRPDGTVDPQKYLALAGSMTGGEMAPPTVDDFKKMDDITNQRTTRGLAVSKDRREVAGGVAAPMIEMSREQRQAYRQRALDLLTMQGMPEVEAVAYLGDLSDEALAQTVGAGIGGDKVNDNIRGQKALDEAYRHNLAGETAEQARLRIAREELEEKRRNNDTTAAQKWAEHRIKESEAGQRSPSDVVGAILDKMARGETVTEAEMAALKASRPPPTDIYGRPIVAEQAAGATAYSGGAPAPARPSPRPAPRAPAARPARPPAPPKPGAVVGGYRFMGGDPKEKANWVKVS